MPLLGKIGPPAIGQPWQGGYYIGDILDEGQLYHLVIAPKSEGQSPSALAWKEFNNTTSFTTSRTNGYANLQGMISTGIAIHPAGNFCLNLTIGGFNDWYPPAIDELSLSYDNRLTLPSEEAFSELAYWSSTQASSTQAITRNFKANTTSNTNKTSTQQVRAMRRVAA